MQPKLIHKVSVTIEPLKKGSSTYDEDFDEPIESGLVYGKEYTIKAQVKIYDAHKIEGSVSGFELKGDGYILATIKDADKINQGDRITDIDGQTYEYYLGDEVPVAHYKSHHFRKIFFKTKDRSKTN